MSVGRVISIFLIDGTASGRMAAELLNWTGKAIRIPRNMLKESSDREELMKTGTYFLFGKDEIDFDTDTIYIGEAEQIYQRLLQHQQVDFWTEAVAIISKDDNLNKAHVRYLEAKLHDLAERAGRTVIRNAQKPTCPSISESEQAVMAEFLSNVRLLVNTLGYKVFDPLVDPARKSKVLYAIKATRGADAKAVATNEGIVVTKGSMIATSTVPSTPDRIIALRQELISSDVVVDQNGQLVFSRDYLFSSPSTAAAVVLGRTANGRIEWKDKAGRTIQELEDVAQPVAGEQTEAPANSTVIAT